MKEDNKNYSKWFNVEKIREVAKEGMEIEVNAKTLESILDDRSLQISAVQRLALKESAVYLMGIADSSRTYMQKLAVDQVPELAQFDGIQYNDDFSKVRGIPAEHKRDVSINKMRIIKIINDEIKELLNFKDSDSIGHMVSTIKLQLTLGNKKLRSLMSKSMAKCFCIDEPTFKGSQANIEKYAEEFLDNWANDCDFQDYDFDGSKGEA